MADISEEENQWETILKEKLNEKPLSTSNGIP